MCDTLLTGNIGAVCFMSWEQRPGIAAWAREASRFMKQTNVLYGYTFTGMQMPSLDHFVYLIFFQKNSVI